MSVATLLEHNSRGNHRGRREAVRFGDRALTFAALEDRSRRLATRMVSVGLEPGDRVAVLLRNGLEWPTVFFAAAYAGVILVPVNVLLRGPEIENVLKDSDPKAVLVDPYGVEALSEVASKPTTTLLFGPEAGESTLRTVNLAETPPLHGPSLASVHDPAMLYYSSGTTAAPKAVVHSHNGVMWNSVPQIADLGIGPDDINLVVASFSWAAGFHTIFLALLTLGGCSVVMPTGGNDIDRVSHAVSETGASISFLVPTLLRQIAQSADATERLRSSRLRYILTGGEAVPVPLLNELSELIPGISVVQAYGLSEFPTLATILSKDEALERVGSAGRATTMTTLAVAAAGKEPAGSGKGEILIRSPASMQEYWQRPDATQAALEDGWLHTGDVGELDEDGYLRVTGRSKDMIISGGLNIYPIEIESILMEIPGVREVAVVATPDPRWGEVPIAVVTTDAAIEEADTIAYCRQRIASYKSPKRILTYSANQLPKNLNGKVLKRELRPWVADRLATEGWSGELAPGSPNRKGRGK